MASTALRASVPTPQATTGVQMRSAASAAHQRADVEQHVAQDEVGALAAAQAGEALLDVVRVRDLGAAIHRDLGRRSDLALQVRRR